jgi:hypothetical protein
MIANVPRQTTAVTNTAMTAPDNENFAMTLA